MAPRVLHVAHTAEPGRLCFARYNQNRLPLACRTRAASCGLGCCSLVQIDLTPGQSYTYMGAPGVLAGGHLNPAVTFSTLICGFYPLLHSILYIALQIAGAILGSLLVAGLIPDTYVGMGDGAPGELRPVMANGWAYCAHHDGAQHQLCPSSVKGYDTLAGTASSTVQLVPRLEEV